MPSSAEKFREIVRGYGIGNSGWIAQCRFPGTFDEHHVDDANDLAGFGIEYGASAVAGISSGIELKDIECSFTNLLDQFLINLTGVRPRQSNWRNGGDNAAMGDR